jgi:invasion protein IalB
VPYTVCDKIGCKAIGKLDAKVLGDMKSGRELFAVLTSPNGGTATVSISLAGFTAALRALK